MTARAVPPTGQPSFPFRDLTLVARRNLTRGLVLSALAHLTLLSAILASRRPEPALRLVQGTVEIVPTPPVYVPPASGEAPPATTQVDTPERAWDPVDEIRFDPRPATAVHRGFVDSGDDKGSSTTPPSESAPPGERVEPAEGVFVSFDEAPVPVHRPSPEYPEWARENGISGTVVLRVLVDRQGNVRQVSIARGVEGLNEAARDALRRWTFRPARTGGSPVAVWVEIPVEFRLGS